MFPSNESSLFYYNNPYDLISTYTSYVFKLNQTVDMYRFLIYPHPFSKSRQRAI